MHSDSLFPRISYLIPITVIQIFNVIRYFKITYCEKLKRLITTFGNSFAQLHSTECLVEYNNKYCCENKLQWLAGGAEGIYSIVDKLNDLCFLQALPRKLLPRFSSCKKYICSLAKIKESTVFLLTANRLWCITETYVHCKIRSMNISLSFFHH